MTDPMVAAIMLTRDRPAMARRAIAAFRAQTYENRHLLIYDTGKSTEKDLQDQIGLDLDSDERVTIRESQASNHHGAAKTIGYLRNRANANACEKGADIIAHWDDDDVSHPRRIEEQVALLQASKKQCVGYNEVLFWDTRPDPDAYFEASDGSKFPDEEPRNESWLYTNPDARYVVGASMCYWRSAWEACPFDDAPHEDRRWWLANAAKCVGVSVFRSSMPADLREEYFTEVVANPSFAPRLICQIHGGNSEAYDRTKMEAGGGGTWQRAPQFDEYCARIKP